MELKLYNIELEASILSSIIFDPSLLEKYGSKLNSDLFYLPSHKNIFEVILDLYKNNKVIDEEIILDKLGKEHEDDLLNVLAKNPLSSLTEYIKILQNYANKRKIYNFSLDIVDSLKDNTDAIELQAKISNFNENIIKNSSFEILEINNIDEIEDRDVEFICKEWLPVPIRTVSLITAPGGTGKSWLVLQFAIRAIQEGRVKKAFLWLSEDPKEITKNRFNKIFEKVLKFDDESIKRKIDISDSQTIQFLYEDQKRVVVSPLFPHFKAKMQKYDLIILDPLIAFFGAEENNNSQARKFMQLFTDWANKENKTIIFVHHSTKNTTQSRGASAFVDAVRTVYELDKVRNKKGAVIKSNMLTIKLTKDNYGISKKLDGFVVEREIFPNQNKIFIERHYEEKGKILDF